MWPMPLLVFLQFTEMDQIMCKSLKNRVIQKKSKLEAKKIDTKSYPSLLLMNGQNSPAIKGSLRNKQLEGTESAELENEDTQIKRSFTFPIWLSEMRFPIF